MSIKCPLCCDHIEPWEGESPPGAVGADAIRPDGAGVCSECYGRWHDAPVYRARILVLETLLLDKQVAARLDKAKTTCVAILDRAVEEIRNALTVRP